MTHLYVGVGEGVGDAGSRYTTYVSSICATCLMNESCHTYG